MRNYSVAFPMWSFKRYNHAINSLLQSEQMPNPAAKKAPHKNTKSAWSSVASYRILFHSAFSFFGVGKESEQTVKPWGQDKNKYLVDIDRRYYRSWWRGTYLMVLTSVKASPCGALFLLAPTTEQHRLSRFSLLNSRNNFLF